MPTGTDTAGSMSSPSIRMLGEPRIPSSSASSRPATAIIWIGVSNASSVNTSTRFWRAGIAAGSPSAYSSSTRIGLRGGDEEGDQADDGQDRQPRADDHAPALLGRRALAHLR